MRNREETTVVWATQKLERILAAFEKFFESTEDAFERMTYWLVATREEMLRGLEIFIQPSKCFQASDGKTIVWSPIQVLFAPDPRRIAALQLHTDKTEKVHQELPPDTNFLHETIAPKNKDTKKL